MSAFTDTPSNFKPGDRVRQKVQVFWGKVLKEILAWVDSLTIEEVQELEKNYKGDKMKSENLKPENLKEFLGQLVGEASMLWGKDQVFESTKATELVERSLKEITEFVEIKK